MNLKKLYAATDPFHIYVAIWNLSCLLSLALIINFSNFFSKYFNSFVVIGGLCGNIIALIVSATVLIDYLILISFKTNAEAKLYCYKNWLGILNGAFVILCWYILFSLWKF